MFHTTIIHVGAIFICNIMMHDMYSTYFTFWKKKELPK